MNDCDCKPGSYAEGWHENRCAECLEAEMDAWRRAVGNFR